MSFLFQHDYSRRKNTYSRYSFRYKRKTRPFDSKVEFDIRVITKSTSYPLSEEDMVESENDSLFLTEFGFSVLEQELLLPTPTKVPSLKTAFENVQKNYLEKEPNPVTSKFMFGFHWEF